MQRYCMILLLIAQIWMPALCDGGYYSIVAPGSIKPHRKYSVSVSLHSGSSPTTIHLELASKSSPYQMGKDVQLQPDETKLIDFLPEQLDNGTTYELRAEGKEGLVFKEKIQVAVLGKGGPRVFIETDRGFYKPQDLVQFHVIILDEHMRPVRIQEPIKVEILDAEKHIVEQFRDIPLRLGVYTGDFKLTMRPPLGKWTIRVHISGKYDLVKEKTFEVKKYVLPKFEVGIVPDPHFTIEDGILNITFNGVYTFGEFVRGTLDAELLSDWDSVLVSKTAQIDVEPNVVISFDLRAISGIKDMDEVIVKAKLTERHTHEPVSKAIVVKLLHRSTNAGDQDKAEVLTKNVQIPANKGHNCHLNVPKYSPGRLPKQIEVQVTAHHDIPYLVYTITGHANIIRNERVVLGPNVKSYTLHLQPDIEMIPTAFLYVYYVQNGHLRYCEATINLPETFENQISLSAPSPIKAGEPITLQIKAQPNSHVSVLAVDTSSMLLNSKNILDKDAIMEELRNDLAIVLTELAAHPGLKSGLVTVTNAEVEPEEGVDRRFGLPDAVERYGPGYFRTKFPETWIFRDIAVTSNNTFLTLEAPDTITTWVVNAFSVNERTGFGMNYDTLEIQIEEKFFISSSLPYSIKRGEILHMPITVFNYLDVDLKTEVLVKVPFDQITLTSEISVPTKKDGIAVLVDVPSDNATTVIFLTRPKVVGDFEIDIFAGDVNNLASDGMRQTLNVESDGIKMEFNEAMYVTLGKETTFSTTFNAKIPTDEIIPNSEYIAFSVGGDVLVPILDNLDYFVDKPTGNAETNMEKFAPNVLVLDYINASDDFANKSDVVKEATEYTALGVRQLLFYRHYTGAYSTDGAKAHNSKTRVPSNWLTAYVTRFFIKANKYTFVHHEMINSGLEYLAEQQVADGSFPKTGYVYHPAAQNKYGLTAFILLTFLENQEYRIKYDKTIQLGVTFLAQNLDKVYNDMYSLAIIANVFQQINHALIVEVVDKLNENAHVENGLKWWSKTNVNVKSANDVEITAYVLLALLDKPGDYVPIVNWLLQKRDKHGGYPLTHDTVVALEALGKFAQMANRKNNLNVEYVAKDGSGNKVDSGNFKMDPENVMVLQTHEFPHTTRVLDVNVNGYGSVYMQFSYEYYVPELKSGYYSVKPAARMISKKQMELNICFSYPETSADSLDLEEAILTVAFPSGFVSNHANEKLVDAENSVIAYVMPINDGTSLELLTWLLNPNQEYCITILGDKVYEVTELKPSKIEMSNCVNSSKKTVVLYDLKG